MIRSFLKQQNVDPDRHQQCINDERRFDADQVSQASPTACISDRALEQIGAVLGGFSRNYYYRPAGRRWIDQPSTEG